MNIFSNHYNNKISHQTVVKTHTAAKIGVFGIAALALGAQAGQMVIGQTFAVEENTNFQVNVTESLAVTVTTPTDTPTGDINTFLRNTVQLAVASNSGTGFTASMYSDASTDLTNTGETIEAASQDAVVIPTLSSSATRSSFPVNRWGYSLASATLSGNTYGESGTESGAIGSAGNPSSTYHPMVATSASPITVLASNTASGTQNIYFGAKADATKAAGTYTGTVIISVVSGVIDESDPSDPGYNPTTPTNPATPNPTPETPSYSGTGTTTGGTTNGSTTYTYTRTNATSGTTASTTQVSSGDNRDSYVNYTPPQGVSTQSYATTTTTNVSDGTPLVAGLAATAATAAASGIVFFILAKRRDDDDEEENPEA